MDSNCLRCRQLLSAAMDGEATVNEVRFVEQHSMTCAECREAQAAYQSIRSRMHSLNHPAPPPQLRTAVMSRINAGGAASYRRPNARAGSRSPLGFLSFSQKLTIATMAGLVVLITGVLIWGILRSTPFELVNQQADLGEQKVTLTFSRPVDAEYIMSHPELIQVRDEDGNAIPVAAKDIKVEDNGTKVEINLQPGTLKPDDQKIEVSVKGDVKDKDGAKISNAGTKLTTVIPARPVATGRPTPAKRTTTASGTSGATGAGSGNPNGEATPVIAPTATNAPPTIPTTVATPPPVGTTPATTKAPTATSVPTTTLAVTTTVAVTGTVTAATTPTTTVPISTTVAPTTTLAATTPPNTTEPPTTVSATGTPTATMTIASSQPAGTDTPALTLTPPATTPGVTTPAPATTDAATPTPTTKVAACDVNPGPVFTAFYNSRADVSGKIGCPAAGQSLASFVYQPFQRGFMLLHRQTGQIYVFYSTSGGQGSWSRYRDPGTGSSSASPTPTPGTGCAFSPVRSFGNLWAATPTVREAIGCPLQAESSVDQGASQSFASGSLFYNPAAANGRRIYVLYSDATFLDVIDTF